MKTTTAHFLPTCPPTETSSFLAHRYLPAANQIKLKAKANIKITNMPPMHSLVKLISDGNEEVILRLNNTKGNNGFEKIGFNFFDECTMNVTIVFAKRTQ